MPEKRTREFIWSIFLCVFAGSFQYGYNISSVNGPAVFIKVSLNIISCNTFTENEEF